MKSFRMRQSLDNLVFTQKPLDLSIEEHYMISKFPKAVLGVS